jgi:hypothetical protein
MPYSNHLANHVKHPELRSDSTLHVVSCVSNPVRYHSRYRMAREWIAAMKDTPNVELHLVEAAFGDRLHELDNEGVDFLPVRTASEVWVKENLINLGARAMLPRDWRYVAWVDADVFFREKGWALETIHQLQHWPVVQPWQQCVDLGPLGNVLQVHQSFGFLNQRGVRAQKHCTDPYPYGHSGFAWACTRAFWEHAQGLMDHCILGSADHHMAWALVGETADTVHRGVTPSFLRLCEEWQRRAMRLTNGHVGFTPGRVEHAFHGPKGKRFYRERWQILVDHGYDPDRDLVRNDQGVVYLSGKPHLEQAIRLYNRSRCEDSIEEA